MKQYMMDSNALSQRLVNPVPTYHLDEIRGEIFLCKDERDSLSDKSEFGMTCFARGTPVVANRQPGISVIVIPRKNDGKSVDMKQISSASRRIRNDMKERPVRDRPLFIYRDGPSWMLRKTPGRYSH